MPKHSVLFTICLYLLLLMACFDTIYHAPGNWRWLVAAVVGTLIVYVGGRIDHIVNPPIKKD